jgi:hypothetical protein
VRVIADVPPHAIAQLRNVRDVMRSMPGVERQILLERHESDIWMRELSLEVVI